MRVRPRMFALTLALLAVPAAAVRAQKSGPMKEEKPGLLKQATVKPDSARRIALALVPGGQVKSEELEVEHGKLAYSFDIALPGTPGVEEILIDARTGAVISREHETPEKEAEEARKDAKRPSRATRRP